MKVLWLDDEIELLRPHILFLEREGVNVVGVSHPLTALDLVRKEFFDVILVDYRMPHVNGIDFAREIKRLHPNIPIVLITMAQEKDVMDEAFSIEVFDYLVKPVQPSQILAVLRKLEKDHLKNRSEVKRVFDYYNRINSQPKNEKGWLERGRLFFQWMVEAREDDLLKGELEQENYEFATWVMEHYPALLKDEDVFQIFRALRLRVFPHLMEGKKVVLFVLDNFRYDQALDFAKTIPPTFGVKIEPMWSVIPTATQFARNALFSGLTPYDSERRNPGWLKDNLHEMEFLHQNLLESGLRNVSFHMKKVNTLEALKQETFKENAQFLVYVINFFDMIFHLRQEESPLRGLIENADDYVNLCKFILETSKLFEKLTSADFVFITTDHGWVKGEKAVVIQGGAETTEGLRFKFGDSLKALEGKPFEILDLKTYGIPPYARQLFLAKGYDYFVYKSDPQRYKKKYQGGLFHGGVTIEELIIPFIEVTRR